MPVLTDELAREHIAANVVHLLDHQKRSRYWLAQQTGEWESRIALVCKGKSVCSAAMLSRIATALGVTTDELLREPKEF